MNGYWLIDAFTGATVTGVVDTLAEAQREQRFAAEHDTCIVTHCASCGEVITEGVWEEMPSVWVDETDGDLCPGTDTMHQPERAA